MACCFVFDLDGTVTTEEILPVFASVLSLEEEITLLTNLTLHGAIPFESSFRLRYALLKSVNPKILRQIASKITINPVIEKFIHTHSNRCFIATGNLNVWIQPLIERLGCHFFSSTAQENESGQLTNLKILRKNDAVISLQNQFDKIVVIGESVNDIPMFEAANVRVAYGGVHPPVQGIIQIADYVCYEGSTLCRLLSTL